MNFTREPIIETVITPRDGYRLLVRATKAAQNEEYSVEALEVVSFGNSIFYRSLERPQAFLLPVGDYEVIETKEAKMALKSVNVERTIKITGSKVEGNFSQEGKQQPNEGKKHHRKKSRRKKGGGQEAPKNMVEGAEVKENAPKPEEKPQPAVFSRLFPPPPTLIKESLNKSREAEIIEANLLSEKEAEKAPSLPNPPVEKELLQEEKKEDFVEPEVLSEPIYNPDSVEGPSKKDE